MEAARVRIDVLGFGRMELNNALRSVPKERLHDAHFLPTRALLWRVGKRNGDVLPMRLYAFCRDYRQSPAACIPTRNIERPEGIAFKAIVLGALGEVVAKAFWKFHEEAG